MPRVCNESQRGKRKMLKEYKEIIAIMSSTVVLILVVLGAVAYSNNQLIDMQRQFVTMQAQVSENQARLAEFIRSHENAHSYIYGGDIEDETNADTADEKE